MTGHLKWDLVGDGAAAQAHRMGKGPRANVKRETRGNLMSICKSKMALKMKTKKKEKKRTSRIAFYWRQTSF
ncbi:unnamed protein product [Prunus armeniaca]|uniref:Uncharacterized protein n=1 Tax=Prunus armeniaca TaxID=36596 RepID=A0A6J5X2P2_PRUAR|nr:unnamed protein product [Prunus armeniaca]CAB4306375.1 unnamed protein product [Prunus armeniaca]